MHTTRDKRKLIARVRRIGGQIAAVERALAEERGCFEVLQTLSAARGALSGLLAEVIEDHLRFHVLEPHDLSTKQAHAADELMTVIRAYVR